MDSHVDTASIKQESDSPRPKYSHARIAAYEMAQEARTFRRSKKEAVVQWIKDLTGKPILDQLLFRTDSHTITEKETSFFDDDSEDDEDDCDVAGGNGKVEAEQSDAEHEDDTELIEKPTPDVDDYKVSEKIKRAHQMLVCSTMAQYLGDDIPRILIADGEPKRTPDNDHLIKHQNLLNAIEFRFALSDALQLQTQLDEKEVETRTQVETDARWHSDKAQAILEELDNELSTAIADSMMSTIN